MNYASLKAAIQAVIKQNGNEEITGDLLQQSLLAMINALGVGYQFVGVATPATNPTIGDEKIMYIAVDSGTYSNFVTPAVTLDGSQIAIFLYSTSWSTILLNVPNGAYIATELAKKVDKVAGKDLSTNDLTDALVDLINGAIQQSNIAQALGDDAAKVISQKAITEILESYAKTSGTYPEFVSGGALTLVGKKPGTATYLLRETGGKGAEVASGQAIVKKIEGNAAAWNQIVKNGDFADNTNLTYENAVGSVSNNICTFKATAQNGNMRLKYPSIVGHKYLLSTMVKLTSATTDIKLQTRGQNVASTTATTEWQKLSTIISVPSGAGNELLSVRDERAADWDDVQVGKMVGFDLTLSGIDNLTTVAQVEAWLANNPGLYPYYAYNPGELLGAKVLGFKPLLTANLLNPTTKKARLVTYDYADGSNQYTVKRLPVGATLKFTPDATGIEEIITPSSDHFTISGNGTLEVVTADSVADVWLIMTWDGTKDDISNFVPYNAPTVEFDTSKIYRDVSGTKTQVFPNGMLKADNAGTVRDAVYFDKNTGKWIADLKANIIDLGEREWVVLNASTGRFFSQLADIEYGISNSMTEKIMCSQIAPNIDATVGTGQGIGIFCNSVSDKQIRVTLSSLIDKTGAQVATALSGIKLVYPLAAPLSYTDLYYKTGDNTYVPMEDVFPDDVVLIINNWATEENLIATPVDNAPQAVAPQVTTQYSMDVVEWIDSANNGTFISDESMDNALTALASAAGLVYDDSAKTWDNGHWDYSGCFSQIEPNE